MRRLISGSVCNSEPEAAAATAEQNPAARRGMGAAEQTPATGSFNSGRGVGRCARTHASMPHV